MVIGLCLILFLVTSCVKSKAEDKESLSAVSEKAVDEKNTAPSTEKSSEPEKKIDFEIKVEREPEKILPELNPQIASLIARGKEINNIQYVYEFGTSNNYKTFMAEKSYTVYLKGDKVRKVYVDVMKFGKNIFYNEVYLDLSKKTAYGICNIKTVSCDNLQGGAYKVDFEAEKLPVTPMEMLNDITPETLILRQEWFDLRNTTLTQFLNKKSQFEYLNLDVFYGLPLRQVISVIQEKEERMLTQTTFTSIAVGHLEDKDVNLPSAYKITEI